MYIKKKLWCLFGLRKQALASSVSVSVLFGQKVPIYLSICQSVNRSILRFPSVPGARTGFSPTHLNWRRRRHGSCTSVTFCP